MKIDTSIVGDSDFLIALFNTQDNLHDQSLRVLANVNEMDIDIVFPTTTMAETITICQKTIQSRSLTEKIVTAVESGDFTCIDVTSGILATAAAYFKPYGSKENTYYQAVVAACAKSLGTNCILSFDPWYKKNGFTLITEKTYR